MDKTEIEYMLAKYTGSKILDFQIDLFAGSITIKGEIFPGGKDNCYLLIFRGVTSYYYWRDNNFVRTHWGKYEYAELAEIYFQPKRNRVSQEDFKKPDMPSYEVFPNFWIEIHSSIFLIEALAIEINGKIFDLGETIVPSKY